jgi:protein required for attachment to host cells
MTVRILLADDYQARFYDVPNAHYLAASNAVLKLKGQLSDPAARLHDRDLKSDRPGRAFDIAPLRAGRRVATAHHAVGAERRPRVHEAVLFAQRIAAALEHARQLTEFDQLVLVAAPHFLGLLRAALSAPLHAMVIAEIHKDLLHAPEHALLPHLSTALGSDSGASATLSTR